MPPGWGGIPMGGGNPLGIPKAPPGGPRGSARHKSRTAAVRPEDRQPLTKAGRFGDPAPSAKSQDEASALFEGPDAEEERSLVKDGREHNKADLAPRHKHLAELHGATVSLREQDVPQAAAHVVLCRFQVPSKHLVPLGLNRDDHPLRLV
jgi:hypothetical protein